MFILFIFFNYKYNQTNRYKNQFIDTHKFMGHIPNNLEIVNLGSTQPTFAFDYNNSGMLGMNWAMGAHSFEYDFKILKKYHNFLKEKAFVLVPVCPFSFFLYCFSDSANYKYYKFLYPSLINNYSNRTKRLYIDYPVLTAGKHRIMLIKDVPADTRLELAHNPLTEGEMKADAKKWIEDIWLKTFSLKSMDNIMLSEENKKNIEKNISILNEMISFCLEKGYRPVIITLPVSEELDGLFPKSFVDEYILLPIHKANKQGVMVLQYWDDNRFCSHNQYFNAFLFNLKGRREFTKTVVDKLFECSGHYDRY
jgi:hypothetical protein